jgi:RimJ/RimL family protein N-acetyltransferase
LSTAMLGYTMVQDCRGQGYTPEALESVLAFAFTKLDLGQVEARVRTANDASKSVVYKTGFKSVGTVRTGKWALGEKDTIEIVEMDVWRLTKKEWELQGKNGISPHL